MTGDRDNPDREFVCQSDPRSDCVVPVSQPDQPRFSNVYFYFYAGATEAKLSGGIQMEFFAPPHEVKPPLTVKGGDPTKSAVMGIVSSTPGRYEMSVAVVAATNGTEHPIRETVPVTVQ